MRTTLRILLALLGASGSSAQSLRIGVWGSYEGVTDGDDWTAAGGRLRIAGARGDAVWASGERLGRYGRHDETASLGAVVHPAARWWLSLEASSSARPEFAPKNSWEAEVTARASGRAALGVGYRRQNYVVGRVDVVMPHLTVEGRTLSLDARLFLARNPSRRTDAAGLVRLTLPLRPGATWWLGGAAGRESYLVGLPPAQQVRSLETVTGLAGARYNLARGMTVRLDATIVRSRPVLSRRGVALALERQF